MGCQVLLLNDTKVNIRMLLTIRPRNCSFENTKICFNTFDTQDNTSISNEILTVGGGTTDLICIEVQFLELPVAKLNR